MDNPFLLQENELGNPDRQNNLQLATVAGVYEDGLGLIPDGETEATQKHYKFLGGAYPSPAVDDRVVVMRMSGTYVVMGKLGSRNTPQPQILPIEQGGSGQSEVYITQAVAEICTTNADFTVSTAYYAQWGKLASLYIGGTFQKTSSSTSDDTTAFTLVPGKRPKITTLARSWRNANAILYANGNMTYHGLATVGTGATFLATYLLA